MDITWHDSDFTFTHSNDARTIGANEPTRFTLLHCTANLEHVPNGNSFSNANNEGYARIFGFEDGLGSIRSWDINYACIDCSKSLFRFINGIKNRKAENLLSSFTRRNPPNIMA